MKSHSDIENACKEQIIRQLDWEIHNAQRSIDAYHEKSKEDVVGAAEWHLEGALTAGHTIKRVNFMMECIEYWGEGNDDRTLDAVIDGLETRFHDELTYRPWEHRSSGLVNHVSGLANSTSIVEVLKMVATLRTRVESTRKHLEIVSRDEQIAAETAKHPELIKLDEKATVYPVDMAPKAVTGELLKEILVNIDDTGFNVTSFKGTNGAVYMLSGPAPGSNDSDPDVMYASVRPGSNWRAAVTVLKDMAGIFAHGGLEVAGTEAAAE